MPKILVLGEQPQFRTLLSESLWFDGHRVESVADAEPYSGNISAIRSRTWCCSMPIRTGLAL